ncbi:DUF6644 family protein [Aurantiacibacter rhizosphaerae]|uniref:DUF6644 domain-containing protein n=1 Tax=Aurantiacibacter rhizosphaerae TaxID=2691582 RepID=A0A844XDN8_9SPHN|nr:DUF6644 family protein [Aurantiacibacter rhizosphaerae]MWV27615.1 hypothetical protein [Aurantiacibacter rhizosphaerae]
MGDFFYGLTEQLRETFLLDAAFWMQETALNKLMVLNFWAVPLAQVMHIMAIAAGFGATLMLTLRVNNLAGGARTVPQVAGRYIPWVWWALIFIVISGFLMLIAEPVRNMINGVFWVKMALLLVTVLITVAFQNAARAQAHAAGVAWNAGGGMRLTSWLIVILWCLIMVCGRWIAYAPV